MSEVLDEISGRVHVVAIPRVAVRVLGKGCPAAGDEMLGIGPLESRSQKALRASTCDGSVSIVLIAAETISMWPNSSAAMLATRS